MLYTDIELVIYWDLLILETKTNVLLKSQGRHYNTMMVFNVFQHYICWNLGFLWDILEMVKSLRDEPPIAGDSIIKAFVFVKNYWTEGCHENDCYKVR